MAKTSLQSLAKKQRLTIPLALQTGAARWRLFWVEYRIQNGFHFEPYFKYGGTQMSIFDRLEKIWMQKTNFQK